MCTTTTTIGNESAPPPSEPLRVGVIGFGPAAMFFCHHVETKKRELLALGKTKEAALLPQVTCFEQASGPGGSWRPERAGADSQWINEPKEWMEFYDYTFPEHFSSSRHDDNAPIRLPAYFTRRVGLEYMLKRCTRHCPDFVERYAVFHQTVKIVTYSAETQTFRFAVASQHEEETKQEHNKFEHYTFDKCIWAAGVHGAPRMPMSVCKAFQNFKNGPVIHSSQLQFPNLLHGDNKNNNGWVVVDPRDKHFLLVGASDSANEVTLQALKSGASKVTIVTRDSACLDYDANWQSHWPLPEKVTVQRDMVPIGTSTGTDGTRTVLLAPSSHHGPNVGKENDDTNEANDEKKTDDDNQEEWVRVEGVHVVVLCTGYEEGNFSMLRDSVWNTKDWTYLEDLFSVAFDSENWTMQTDENSLNKFWKRKNDMSVALPAPPDTLYVNRDYFSAGVSFFHQCICMSNPNLIIMAGQQADVGTGVLVADVQAKFGAEYLLGNIALPTSQAVVEQNIAEVREAMHVPSFRMTLDFAYERAVYKHIVRRSKFTFQDRLCMEREVLVNFMHTLARTAEEANHPVSKPLQDESKVSLLRKQSYQHSPGRLKTFRDLTEQQCQVMSSLYTSITPVPLKDVWFHLSDHATPEETV